MLDQIKFIYKTKRTNFESPTFTMNISLHKSCISHIHFDKYPKDFTFLINGEQFKTSSFLADLLSPNISSLRLTDPTINEYSITTDTTGDFKKVLDLVKEDHIPVKLSDIPFFKEILNKLGTEIIFDHEEENITVENVVSLIQEHLKLPTFFQKELSKDIEFLSSNFYLMSQNQKDQLISFPPEIEEMILRNDKLRVESEDQVLDFVNHLYERNHSNSYFYEFVYFSNVSETKIEEFLNVFDINDITTATWSNLSERLKLKIEANNENLNIKRYIKQLNYYSFKKREVDISYKKNEFNGIFNYLKTTSNIMDEVEVTASSEFDGSLNKIIQYDSDAFNGFCTESESKSWICFKFKNHHIIPSNYTIRSIVGNGHLKSWNLEGSNDGVLWIPIDLQRDSSVLNGSGNIFTFNIPPLNSAKYKYLRIHQIDKNWYGKYNLCISKIEFFGKLVD